MQFFKKYLLKKEAVYAFWYRKRKSHSLSFAVVRVLPYQHCFYIVEKAFYRKALKMSEPGG